MAELTKFIAAHTVQQGETWILKIPAEKQDPSPDVKSTQPPAQGAKPRHTEQ